MLKDRSLTGELIQPGRSERISGPGHHGRCPRVGPPRGRHFGDRFALARPDGAPAPRRSRPDDALAVRFSSRSMKDPQVSWEHLAWLREQTTLPIWLKESCENRTCCEPVSGASMVSCCPITGDDSSTALLSPTSRSCQSARVQAVDQPSYGVCAPHGWRVRRGSDVFHGARAGGGCRVASGRPVRSGGSPSTEAGSPALPQVLNLLNQELALTMTLAESCAQLSDITPDLLRRPMFRAVSLGGGCGVSATAPRTRTTSRLPGTIRDRKLNHRG